LHRFGTVPYVDFLIPGMVMTSVLITGTGIAVGVAEDSEQGFSDRLRSLPAPRMALLAGRALGDTGVLAWGTAVTAAIGFALGFRLHGTVAQALLAFGLCNAVRSLALGDPALAGLSHATSFWALLSLAWAAGITLIFALLAATLYGRSA
jgi:ABC-type Na+ efflux pump permease subunit